MLGHHCKCDTSKPSSQESINGPDLKCENKRVANRENQIRLSTRGCHSLATLPPAWMRGKRPMTKSCGKPARLPLETTKARPFSSSATSKFRPIGPKPRPTSSPASIFTAKWAPRSANIAWPNWCTAWSTPSPIGASTMAISPSAEDGEAFRSELAHLMLHQKACFNSPVWFNVGVQESRGYGWFYDAASTIDQAADR